MKDDNIHNLYEAIKDEYDLGTEDEFRQSLSSTENQKNLYNALKNEYDIGSEEDFMSSLGSTTAGEPAGTTAAPGTFTEAELMEQDKKLADKASTETIPTPVAKPGYGSSEWLAGKVADEVDPQNPYIGMTGQQALNALGRKYFDKWYGEGIGAYGNIRTDAAAYLGVDPSETSRVALDIRNSYIPTVARKRVEQILEGVKNVNGGNLDEVQRLFNSREAKMAIEDDLRKLGLSSGEGGYGEGEEESREKAVERENRSREHYYKELEGAVRDVLTDKYGYMAPGDGRSFANIVSHAIMSSGSGEHEERIREREAADMTQDYLKNAIEAEIAEYDAKAEKARSEARRATGGYTGYKSALNPTTTTGLQGAELGKSMYEQRAANQARDPEKIIASLREKSKLINDQINSGGGAADPEEQLEWLRSHSGSLLKEVLSNEKFLNDVKKKAESFGITPAEYITSYTIPNFIDALEREFHQQMVEKNMPRSKAEYVLRGLEDSLLGMLASRYINTPSQQQYRNEADAMTAEGKNPNVTSNVWTQGGRLATGMIADAPMWMAWGKMGSAAASKLMSERATAYAADRGITKAAALRLMAEEGKQYLRKGIVDRLISHIPSSAVTMAGAEATSELGRGIRDRETVGEIIGNTLGAALRGGTTGTAFGITGGVMGRLTSKLKGVKRIAGKLAGLEAEAATMYTTEELQKLASGEDAFEGNFFEDLLKTNVKLGFIKGSANPAATFAKFYNAVRHPVKSWRTAMKGDSPALTEEDVAYIENSQGGKKLMNALDGIRPDPYDVREGERIGLISKEAAAEGADAYRKIMTDRDCPQDRKVRIARLLGGLVRPAGAEVSAEIVPDKNDAGQTIVRTRDIDGQCVRELRYDSVEDAETGIADMNAGFFKNTTEALEGKVNATDAYVRFTEYFEEAYRIASEKLANGEELTKAEKRAIYLHQHQDELLDVYTDIEAGNELSEDGQNLADLYREHFEWYVRSGKSLHAFTEAFEREHGLKPGAIDEIKNKESLTTEDADLLEAYHNAMREHIAEAEERNGGAGGPREGDRFIVDGEEWTVWKNEDGWQQVRGDGTVRPLDMEAYEKGKTDGGTGGSGTGGAGGTGGTGETGGKAGGGIDSAGGEAGTGTGAGANNPPTTTAISPETKARRDAAYQRGLDASSDKGSLSGIGYDVMLADARMAALFPASDPVLSRLRSDIMKAVESGNDAEADRLVETYKSRLSREQLEAIEQYRDMAETRRGVDDSLADNANAYAEEFRRQIEPYVASDGTITPLVLMDGSVVYYKAGDLSNELGGLIVTTEDGTEKQIRTSMVKSIGDSEKLEDRIAAATDKYAEELQAETDALVGGSGFVPGMTVDMKIGGYMMPMTYVGTDAQGRMVFNEPGGKQSSFMPQDVQALVADARRQKIADQLKQEKEAAVLQQQKERFDKGIAGHADGTPDLSAAGNDAKTVAEYLASQMSDGGTAGHNAVLKHIDSQKEQLAHELEQARAALGTAENAYELSEDGSAEQAQAESDMKALRARIDNIVQRQRKWGEVRQESMSAEERVRFEAARAKVIGRMKEASRKTAGSGDNKRNGDGETAATAAIPTGKELLEQYQEQGQAADAVEELQKATKKQWRDVVQPKLSVILEQLSDYQRGLVELSEAEVKALTDQLVPLEAQAQALTERSKKLKELNSSLGRLYAGRRKAAMTPHERMLDALDKEPDPQKKIEIAKQFYGEYGDAAIPLEQLEPKDIYEWVADNLGYGTINWEGIQRGEHYVRGLSDMVGKDKQRGIGKGSDTIGYNYFLAPEGQGKGYDEVVHAIAESSPYTTEEVSDALYDMLTSARKPTDISHRIIDDRISRAEEAYQEYRRQELEAEDEAIREMTGMEPEEYEEWMNRLEEEYAALEGYRNSEEYFKAIEDYDRRNEANAGTGEAAGIQQEQGKEVEPSAAEAGVEAGAGAAEITSEALARRREEAHEASRKAEAEKKQKLKEASVSAMPKVKAEAERMAGYVSNITDGTKGKKQIAKAVERMLEKADSADLLGVLNECMKILANTSKMNPADAEKINAAIERIIDNAKAKGFIIDLLPGKKYDEGYKVTADFVEDPSLPYGTRVIVKTRMPQVVFNGEMVQKADVIVHQNRSEPEPVGTGDFGPIYDQFKGKPKEAIALLLEEQTGEAVGALSHKDVGEIDLVWGEEGTGKSDGFGLAKLAKYHPEVLENLQEILDDMHVVSRSDNRINLESDTHKAAVRLTWNAQKKKWLLTAFEKKNSALDNTTDTGKTPEGGKRNDTATPQSTVSAGKGTENNSNVQEKEGKFSERLAAAKKEVAENPTDGQKKAGNYRKGHLQFGGYEYTIEVPRGGVRSGVDAGGKPWSVTMQDTYGYIRGKKDADGDHIDFFINDDADLDNWTGRVYVVDQKNPDGSFDEHKVMYGYDSWAAAKKAYERNYEPGFWDSHVMQMTGVKKEDFDKWLDDSDRKTKPFAEYARTKRGDTITDNVDQLIADVRERVKYLPTWTEEEIRGMEDSRLEQLLKKRKIDLSTSRYLLKAAGVEGSGTAKETLLNNNIIKAETDIRALEEEKRRRAAAAFDGIDFMIGDMAGEPGGEAAGTTASEKNAENVFPLGKKSVTLQSQEAVEAVKGQKATLAPTAPWREGVEDVTVHTSLPTIRKKYNELHAKAKAGDVEAAAQLVEAVVKPEKVKALAEQHPNARVAFVHAEEATGRNAIPTAYATYLEQQGLSLSEIVQTNKPSHTGSDRVGRFIRRARFDGEVVPGAEYIIVDDHVTMGSTLRDLKDYIESKGGKVVAVSTLTASAGGTKLRPTEEQIRQLNEKGITNEQLKELGIADSIDGLTRREAAEILVLADKGGDTGSSRGRKAENSESPRVLGEEEGSIDAASEASIVELPRINNYGLNENSPIGRKLTRLKKQGGDKTLAGFTDSETGDLIFLGDDAGTIDENFNIKTKQTGTVDGMPSLTVPYDELDVISPRLVRDGYKLAITDDKIDPVDTMLDEVERRKEVAEDRKTADKTVNDHLARKPQGTEEQKVRVRATKAVLKALDNAGVPYRVVSKEEEREMVKLFSLMNEEAVKEFARSPYMRATSDHGNGRYCVYNMENPFGVPLYAEKQSVARWIKQGVQKYGGTWKILDIGEPGQAVEKSDAQKKAADMQLSVVTKDGETIQFMVETPEGQKDGKHILGWSDGKGVYLTEAGLNPNTPIHECTHLWDKWCQKKEPELWKKMVRAMKQTKVWEEIRQNPNYRNIWEDEDRMASEVHSRLSGATGEEEFMKAAFKKGTPQKIIDEVKSVLRKFWERILRLFGKETKTIGSDWDSVDALIRMPIRDLVNQDFEKVMKAADAAGEAASVEAHIVTDKEETERLDREPKEVGYRNVVLNEDGSLGSPMADKLGKKGEKSKATTPFEFGKWERSDEHPELATDNGKIDLIKPDGLGTVGSVDYNPYIHIRPTTLNKQFKNAWERPNLVYIETEYPKSELDGDYKAEKAAKAVGKHPWGGGELILSRWDKPVRMVPWEEVADDWVKEFKGRGVEFDIIPPKLLPILAERGVEILPPHKGMGKECNEAYERWKAEETQGKETLNNANKGRSASELFLSLQEKEGKELYESAKEINRRIESGEARINRLGEEAERGRRTVWHRIGTLLAGGNQEHVGALRGGAEETEISPSWSRREALQKETDLHNLRIARRGGEAIRRGGGLIPEGRYRRGILSGRFLGSGTESDVYLSKDGKKVIKFMRNANTYYEQSLLKRLDDLALWNTVFPETAYDVIGFGNEGGGHLKVVAEQPYIEGKTAIEYFHGDSAKAYKYIDDYLENELGFEAVRDEDGEKTGIFKKGDLYIRDINYKNVIIDKDGNPHVIDGQVERIDDSGQKRAKGLTVEDMHDVMRSRKKNKKRKVSLENIQEAENIIDKWLKENKRGQSFEIELPQKTLDKINKEMGQDYESHNITINEIVHANKKHGENGYGLKGNDIPLSGESLKLIPYIMVNPDRVKRGSTDIRNRESIRFEKNLGNGVVIVVEKEKINNPQEMQTATMWANMSSRVADARTNASPALDARNVITSFDAAKIRKDAETAIENDKKMREEQQNSIKEAADAAAEQLGGVKLNYAAGDDIADEALKHENENGTLGQYNPNDGSVTLFLDNIEDADEAVRTVYHEKLGHEGLAALFAPAGEDAAGTTAQDEVNKFGQFIFRNAGKGLKKRILDKADEEGYEWNDPLRLSKAAQEVFADIAADGPATAEEFSLWRKVKHYIIDTLRRLGRFIRIPGLLNDKDLRYYVLKTGEALKRWNGMSETARENLSAQSNRYDIMRSRGVRPRKHKDESMSQYLERVREWERWKKAMEDSEAANDPMPDKDSIDKKWEDLFHADMEAWRQANGIPAGEAAGTATEGPGEFPKRREGESPQDYAIRVTDYETQKDLWKGAPNYFDYMQKAQEEYRHSYDAWKTRYDLQEAENVDMALYEGRSVNHPENWNELEVETRMMLDLADEMGVDLSENGARNTVKIAIIDRRSLLNDSNFKDAVFINDLIKRTNEIAKQMSQQSGQKVTGKMLREALPFIIEGTYWEEALRDENGEVVGYADISDQLPIKKTPELEELLSDIKEWYDQFFYLLEDEGLRGDAGYIPEGYVNHVWDKAKSDKKAWERYVETHQRQRSPNMKHREIDTYQQGIDVGLVPKFTDIAKIMSYYSASNNEAIANSRFLKQLSGISIEERNSDGEVVSVLPILNSHEPDFEASQYEVFRINAGKQVWVHKAVAPRFANVFGAKGVEGSKDWQKRAYYTYDLLSSTAKKSNLSLSFFHAGALLEVYLAQAPSTFGPLRAMKNLVKYLIMQPAKRRAMPAYATPEDAREAAAHMVKLGATDDYAAADVLLITEKLRKAALSLEKKVMGVPGLLTGVTTVADWFNKGMDKFLWSYLHDGLKIAMFKMYSENLHRQAEKEDWDKDTLNRMLNEAGQYVNDTFGGQFWELINWSPNNLKLARFLLLSPDWLVSTTRHALATTGFGSLYSDSGFWNYMQHNRDNLKKMFGKDVPRSKERWLRQGSALLCYALGVQVIRMFVSALNALFRSDDVEKEEEREKNEPGYVSKYKLMYPNGMKWYDYLPSGNSLGKQSYLFVGRYSDGTEQYLRWGKQFRELPEYFENEKGELEFPWPLAKRFIGKSNPIIRQLLDNYIYMNPFTASQKDKEEKARFEKMLGNTAGRTAGVLWRTKDMFLPFLFSGGDKELTAYDLVLPSSKGMSKWKAQDYFKDYILSDDRDGIELTYRSCLQNGINPEEQFEAALKSIKALERKSLKGDADNLQDAVKKFDASSSPKERAYLRNSIKKQVEADEYKAIGRNEFMENVSSYLNGEESVGNLTKAQNIYLERETSDDVLEDIRVMKLEERIGKAKKEKRQMEEAGIEEKEVRKWAEQPSIGNLFAADKVLGDYKRKQKKHDPGYEMVRRQLGSKSLIKGDEVDDAQRMEYIRKKRKEMLEIIDDIEKRDLPDGKKK